MLMKLSPGATLKSSVQRHSDWGTTVLLRSMHQIPRSQPYRQMELTADFEILGCKQNFWSYLKVAISSLASREHFFDPYQWEPTLLVHCLY